jgi:isoleucyl-tRNA synthetase
VNVKNFKFVDNEAGVLVKRVKPDFKKLGPKFGKTMKSVAAAITSMSQQDIASLEKNGNITLNVDGNDALIEAIDVEIISEDIPGWLVANEGNITIALDVTITDELKQEGIARDIVNRVQNIRKSRDYDITDKINLIFAPNVDTDAAINAYSDYIARQVLATSITIGNILGLEGVETLEIDEIKVDVSISK